MALSPLQIKVELLKRGDSVAALARRWKTTREIVSRVIHRDGKYVYPEVRQKLARYLGVSISEVGQDPKRSKKVRRKAA
jgi:lambda repressor-like predicted transcriptional regulator